MIKKKKIFTIKAFTPLIKSVHTILRKRDFLHNNKNPMPLIGLTTHLENNKGNPNKK